MPTITTASVIANSRTPYSVVIRIANAGTPDSPTGQIPRATLAAQLLEGPLRELILRTPDLRDLNFVTNNGPADFTAFVRITAIDGGLDATLTPPSGVGSTLVLIFLADALEFGAYALAGDDPPVAAACDFLVELRCIHSNER
jgi:hypothetical protein